MNWHSALAQALTGEVFDLPDHGSPDFAALAAELAEHGWRANRIKEHAHARAAAGQGWPHAIDPAVVTALGAARFQATLARLREQLGVWVLDEQAPSHRTQLNADELRLLAEVPPHHGH
ncbi:MAG: hypothetical protein LBI99_00640 [Propionibacteriaceae bacterium]|jgi:hypothetical protein|nr:hypothetical protein [Propionibacteriaceae bacterium]